MDIFIRVIAGFVVGMINYCALYLTIKKVINSKNPYIFILSFIVRNMFVVYLFYVLMNGSIKNLLAALFGFLVSRTIAARYFKTFNNGVAK